jgi:hypothetical protein
LKTDERRRSTRPPARVIDIHAATHDHIREAVLNLRPVSLYVAPDKYMFHPAPGDLDFPNEFRIEGAGAIPVPHLCQLTDVDASLIHDIFFHYRAEELHSGITSPTIRRKIPIERRQIITNLLPFRDLWWYEEVKHSHPRINKQIRPLGMLHGKEMSCTRLQNIKSRIAAGKRVAQPRVFVPGSIQAATG